MSFTGALAMILAMHRAGPAGAGARELFPGVRADLVSKIVEFDGRITPMLVKDARAPLFFLEVLACSPNTREHETFVVSAVRPSHIHAALLAIGLNPGSPGSWTLKDGKLQPTQPTGDRVSVRIVFMDERGCEVEADPLEWIVNARNQRGFADSEARLAAERHERAPGWVFAGSKLITRNGADKDAGKDDRKFYDADGSGTIIGLTTFGSEVIAWSRVISPDSSVEEPEWIANFARTPPPETSMIVRIRKAD